MNRRNISQESGFLHLFRPKVYYPFFVFVGLSFNVRFVYFTVDWDKEIEEELENQKRKKKSTSSTSSLPEPQVAKISTPIATNNVIPALRYSSF